MTRIAVVLTAAIMYGISQASLSCFSSGCTERWRIKVKCSRCRTDGEPDTHHKGSLPSFAPGWERRSRRLRRGGLRATSESYIFAEDPSVVPAYVIVPVGVASPDWVCALEAARLPNHTAGQRQGTRVTNALETLHLLPHVPGPLRRHLAAVSQPYERGPETCVAHPRATRGHCSPATALPCFGGAAKTRVTVLTLTPSVLLSVLDPLQCPSMARGGVPRARRSTAAGDGMGPGRTKCRNHTWHGRRRHCSPRRAPAACGQLP
jgi:hypothetical protein